MRLGFIVDCGGLLASIFSSLVINGHIIEGAQGLILINLNFALKCSLPSFLFILILIYVTENKDLTAININILVSAIMP